MNAAIIPAALCTQHAACLFGTRVTTRLPWSHAYANGEDGSKVMGMSVAELRIWDSVQAEYPQMGCITGIASPTKK